MYEPRYQLLDRIPMSLHSKVTKSRKNPGIQMPKRRTAVYSSEFAEILTRLLEPAFHYLHADQLSATDGVRSLERQQILRQFAAIVDEADTSSAGSSVVDSKAITAYYLEHGFPGPLGKDFRDGLLTRPMEFVLPIFFSAYSIKTLMWLCDCWKERNVRELRQRLVRLTVVAAWTTDPRTEIEIRQRTEKAVSQAIEWHQSRKCRFVSKSIRKIVSQPIRRSIYASCNYFQFANVEVAWLSLEETFTFKEIEPFASLMQDLDDTSLLACAEDQLIKAANIMLVGVQPRIERMKDGILSLESYRPMYLWHVIAIAFAEYLTGKIPALRFCSTCGCDISLLKKDAKRCRECAAKKRR